MLQYKRKRTGTSSSNPNAKENAESLTATRKRGITTLQSMGGQPSGEEKSDQSSDDQSSEMEKNSKNNSDLSSEEKSDENSNENSSEEKKDGESHGDESSREEQSEESESEQSDEKEEEGIESSPNYVKIISNDKKEDRNSLAKDGVQKKCVQFISIGSKLDSTKSQYNLHGCPWCSRLGLKLFLRLQRLAKDSSPEKSIPRMIKWMAGTPAYKTNIDPIYQTKEQ
ncbi:hypothetical protein H5410_012422, partial [Solanum commersonii]